jgi:hypothetical protein
MLKITHYQNPCKIRERKQLPYDRDKGNKDLLGLRDEVVNEEMRKNYDNLHATIPQGASKCMQKNTLSVS